MSKKRKSFIITLIMLSLSVSLKLFSMDSDRVELMYSRGLYPAISGFLRHLFGLLPFSLGDIFYALVFLYLFFLVVRLFYRLIKRRLKWITLNIALTKTQSFIQLVLSIYIVFNILWGLNYNRKPVDEQLQISLKDTSLSDLKDVNLWLLNKVNEEKRLSLNEKFIPHDFNYLRREAELSYKALAEQSSIAGFKAISLKPTLYSWIANSSGYTGYYNPFTGEAQVNYANPFYELPFVTCHEMAHQLGYAKEMEANFIGFLACEQSKNHLFKYSAYKAMLGYALGDMASADLRFTRSIYDSLSVAVKQDIRFSRRFRSQQSRLLQPLVMGIYEKYLWSNEQPQGLLSYNEVTGLLIGYYKKHRYKSFL